MQMKRANEIAKDWDAAGRPPCEHPHLDKEFHLGSSTGDYICTTCGEAFSREERRALHNGNQI
ncbi:hypothetical protein E3T26_03915 [Cryobacterium sp. TMT1-21]|nr:hypothetical protein E3T26_03915 [Cryobacterium sp. TMT1-21]